MTVAISRVSVEVFRAPVEHPVSTSFGIMHDRPAVFVRVEDSDGAFGWGEIFANWPAAGPEHRARLLVADVADLFLGRTFRTPMEMFDHLTTSVRTRAIQCGEPGPFAQVIAGLDTAVHDLCARREGRPLAASLNEGRFAGSVPCYASGIAAAHAESVVARARADGFTAFKIKVGFEHAADVAVLSRVSEQLGPGERMMCDANQAWSRPEAERFCHMAEDIAVHWLEEPLAADTPAEHWSSLAKVAPPLAAGENIMGSGTFANAIDLGALQVIQPDVAKWGGLTGCAAVARRAIAAGRRYCPHFLGGGIGLLASSHLLAAMDPEAANDGLLEVDVNPNPLRDAFLGDLLSDGRMKVADEPGLGVTSLPEELDQFRTLELSRTER